MSEHDEVETAGPARDLADRLAARIRADGPIGVGAYMAEALYDRRAGYYATKDPIGAGGDYVTAPEISQMFGELIGLWTLQCWSDMGAPAPFRLIELGPGRATMMSDVLRAARLSAEFCAALSVTLVEVSPALKGVQAQTLADAPAPVGWVDVLDKAPAGPCVILGNEFLDCLPVRQFVRVDGAWRERLVALGPDAEAGFVFALSPAPAAPGEVDLIPARLRDSEDGALVETRPTIEAVMETLAARFETAPGHALFIDYGPAQSEIGDTLQALQAHEKVDPLQLPGERDLTARVDFEALAEAARARGLKVSGPKAQGAFLNALGFEQRAAALSAARPDMKSTIARQVLRLCDPDEMGVLFQAICVSASGAPDVAGF